MEAWAQVELMKGEHLMYRGEGWVGRATGCGTSDDRFDQQEGPTERSSSVIKSWDSYSNLCSPECRFAHTVLSFYTPKLTYRQGRFLQHTILTRILPIDRAKITRLVLFNDYREMLAVSSTSERMFLRTVAESQFRKQR